MYDVVCFSHLRWNFVFQRPQHLMTRCARRHRTVFVEEPVWADKPSGLDKSRDASGVEVWVPHLDPMDPREPEVVQAELLASAFAEERLERALFWYFTPAAIAFSRELPRRAVVYDAMDELSAFKDAPRSLIAFERELLREADLVFTGGRSIYEAKRELHPSVHAFPSGVDVAHFARARESQPDPEDQAAIPHPRLGFFGVIDERLDIELLAKVAAKQPDWHFVLLGPVVKISPTSLPQARNLHYLGPKTYEELPSYLSGWDVCLLPFARNEATRFISPTKTPEYLSALKPVVSTSIRDVVTPYGERGFVRIADSPDDFVEACRASMQPPVESWQSEVQRFLAASSWDRTWTEMERLMDTAMARHGEPASRSVVSARNEEQAQRAVGK